VLIELLKADAGRYRPNNSMFTVVKLSLLHPGFQAVIRIRLIQIVSQKSPTMASLLRVKLLRKYGCDISPGFQAGKGLRIEHPVGIVIGSKVIIGENCTVSQGVTIGEKYIDHRSSGQYPVLGNHISIGVNTIILGKITIGNNVSTGANSLILTNVPPNTTVVGVYNL
jgi:serine O-acetyltransferase